MGDNNPSEPTQITTVRSHISAEIDRVKGSRFIADVAPAADEESARRFLETVRTREPSATHHCWAFRLSSGRALSSDDGEPRDTAGPPILRRIEGAGLSDVVAVVTRYYGGTNLGRGGLIRAYGAATVAALNVAPVKTRSITTTFEITYHYEVSGIVDGVIAGFGGTIADPTFADTVSTRVEIPLQRAAEFIQAMTERTSGEVVPRTP